MLGMHPVALCRTAGGRKLTRTHVDEFELIELQRKARSIFARIDSLAVYMWNREEKFSSSMRESVESAAHLCREVSDAVDQLTDYVRHSRMLD